MFNYRDSRTYIIDFFLQSGKNYTRKNLYLELTILFKSNYFKAIDGKTV